MSIWNAKLYGLYLIPHHENFELTNQKANYYGIINSKISKPIFLIALERTISIFSITYGKLLLSHFFSSTLWWKALKR